MNALPAGQQPVRLIDNAAALAGCLAAIATQTAIAFDLEFDNNLRGYGITLCLIQVATPDVCYLIDPLAGMDLSGLYALFEDPKIEKIVHSPGEDLRLLHSLGCYPKNLFDVQVVAILLNYEHISLAALLAEKMGLTLSKGQQRSDWRQRPLSPAQSHYAAADVMWLYPLKNLLVAEAHAKGLIPFIIEEQTGLSTTIYKTEVKQNFLKPADLNKLSPRDQYVLNALFRYRDGLARTLNKPPFQVMDETIVRALADGSLQPHELSSATGLHHSLKKEGATRELVLQLQAIHSAATALSLATVLPRRKLLTRDEQTAREQANRDKPEKFAPLQEVLAQQFGQSAARFILSNGTVNDLLLHTITIKDLKPYRQALLRDAASRLNIDLSRYE